MTRLPKSYLITWVTASVLLGSFGDFNIYRGGQPGYFVLKDECPAVLRIVVACVLALAFSATVNGLVAVVAKAWSRGRALTLFLTCGITVYAALHLIGSFNLETVSETRLWILKRQVAPFKRIAWSAGLAVCYAALNTWLVMLVASRTERRSSIAETKRQNSRD